MSEPSFRECSTPIDIVEIRPSKFTKMKSLGSDCFAEVFTGEWKGTTVTVKQLHLRTLNSAFLQDFRNEVSLLANCRHPCIVCFFGVSLQEGYYQLIFEFLPRGSLYQNLSNPEITMPMEPLRLQIALDISRGLNYLHCNNIIHKDLMSTNVLLTNEWTAKITGFGLSQVKAATEVSLISRMVATAKWCAPEILKCNSVHNRASDVWSLGMVFWEIVSRKFPFSEANENVVMEYGEKENIPRDCPPLLAQVIVKCWSMDPLERPQASWIINMLETEVTKKLGWASLNSREKDTVSPPPIRGFTMSETRDATIVSPRFSSKVVRVKDGVVISNNGSTVAYGGESHRNIVSATLLANGRFKWMMRVDEMEGHYALLGVIEANKAREAEKGIDIGSFGWAMQVYSTSTLDFFGESKQIAFGSGFKKGDVLEIVLDTNEGELVFYHNGKNYRDRIFYVPKGRTFIPAVTIAKRIKVSFVDIQQ